MARALTLALLLLAPMAQAKTVTVRVQFDDASLAALTKVGELVVISGYFFGEPGPKATMKADDIGQIYLSGEELTIWPKEQTVILGQSLAAAPVDQVVEPYLNINVYTARFTSEDNLIDCSLVDDKVAVLAKAEQVITCKMIGG